MMFSFFRHSRFFILPLRLPTFLSDSEIVEKLKRMNERENLYMRPDGE